MSRLVILEHGPVTSFAAANQLGPGTCAVGGFRRRRPPCDQVRNRFSGRQANISGPQMWPGTGMQNLLGRAGHAQFSQGKRCQGQFTQGQFRADRG